jgi:hypothetical protein
MLIMFTRKKIVVKIEFKTFNKCLPICGWQKRVQYLGSADKVSGALDSQ